MRTLTPPPDKSTLRLDPPQYVSTGNSITLRSTSQDFLSDSWEKGSSHHPWALRPVCPAPVPSLAGREHTRAAALPLSGGHGAAGETAEPARGPELADGWLDLADS